MSEMRESTAMCEECERVPVPVYLVTRGRLSGLWICATCLAGEGIHLAEEDAAALFDDRREELFTSSTKEGAKK